MLKTITAAGRIISSRSAGTVAGKIGHRNVIGDREIVGSGMNGRPEYMDDSLFPFPAIKFRPSTPEFKVLEEKAKGDWKKLSLVEKKQLYRMSFCQTFSEMNAPTGEWKTIIGFGLIFVSLSLWFYLFVEWLIDRDIPTSMLPENQKAQLKRMIDLQMNPVTGLSSRWDYEKNEWKKTD